MAVIGLGRILAVDFGDRRIGIAVSDPLQVIATAHSTIDRRKTPDYMQEICKLSDKFSAAAMVVGLPLTMKGTDSEQTKKVREFAAELEKQIQIPVVLVDERLSSVAAQQTLIQKGVKTGHNKSAVDRTSAAVFLQEYLDSQSS